MAVLISWSLTVARSRSSSPTPSRAGDIAVDRPNRQQQPHQAAILHLTARDLHKFLFGTSHDYRSLLSATARAPDAAVAARTGKRRRIENCNETRNTATDLGPHFGHGGGVGAIDDEFKNRRSKSIPTKGTERSEAAAAAAGEGQGDGDGGGWCLLQKFIGPAGRRSSTLRFANDEECCSLLANKTRH